MIASTRTTGDFPAGDATDLLVIPQWQGSASPRARSLVAGAHRLAGTFPPGRRTVIAVEEDAGEPVDGVRGLATLRLHLDRVRAALAEMPETPIITVGGDCGVELGPIGELSARLEGRLAVVWFDAHPDLNTPASSASGAFHGMVLRTLLGEGPADLAPPPTGRLGLSRVILAGVRATDVAEVAYMAATGIRNLGVADLGSGDALIAAVRATSCRHVYVHVDLDVFDPAEFAEVGYSVHDGLAPGRLFEAIRGLRETFVMAGVGVTEHLPQAPSDHSDQALRGLGAALTGGLA